MAGKQDMLRHKSCPVERRGLEGFGGTAPQRGNRGQGRKDNVDRKQGVEVHRLQSIASQQEAGLETGPGARPRDSGSRGQFCH